ncbi:MAG: hypothetical protein JJE46_10835 [Acidimicrobiia bacterium]|nr:hypothetical protein [Acidimicrobiia bacterium]
MSAPESPESQAWSDFCAQLDAAGAKVLAHAETDLDRAEGYRYLSRLARGGLERFLEHGDAQFPTVPTLTYNLKIGCDNPDAHYQHVTIDPAHSYRLSGARGTVNYLGVGAYSGGYTSGAATPGRQAYVEFNAPTGPDEWVDIIVSREEPATLPDDTEWLQTTNATRTLIIRNFFADRETERSSDLRIECLDRDRATPTPLTGRQVADGLAMAGLFVHGVVDLFVGWVDELFRARPNTLDFLPADDTAGGWADPNQLFRHGYWRLAEGEALLIEFTPPECRYWNFQLNNIWEESLDYRTLSVTVNQHTARHEPDGSVRIVVAERDAGIGNWMDTAGHRHGTMGLRWNQAVADVAPRCTVVPLADLGGR